MRNIPATPGSATTPPPCATPSATPPPRRTCSSPLLRQFLFLDELLAQQVGVVLQGGHLVFPQTAQGMARRRARGKTKSGWRDKEQEGKKGGRDKNQREWWHGKSRATSSQRFAAQLNRTTQKSPPNAHEGPLEGLAVRFRLGQRQPHLLQLVPQLVHPPRVGSLPALRCDGIAGARVRGNEIHGHTHRFVGIIVTQRQRRPGRSRISTRMKSPLTRAHAHTVHLTQLPMHHT